MAYLWTEQSVIQSYLDGEKSSIQIQEEGQPVDVVKNFARDTAIQLENEAVFEVATLLSMAFIADPSNADTAGEIDVDVLGDSPLGFKPEGDSATPGTYCPRYLSLLTAKLTASKIATVRLGSSLSSLPNWIRAYKNEIFSQIQRLVVNSDCVSVKGLQLREDFDLADVLMRMKTREHSAEELQN